MTGQQAIFRDSIALIIHVHTQSLRVNEQVKLEGEGEEEEGKQSRKMTAVAKEKNQIRSKWARTQQSDLLCPRCNIWESLVTARGPINTRRALYNYY